MVPSSQHGMNLEIISINNCVTLFMVLTLASLLAAEQQCVPGVTYLDPVTGHCDPCSDICEYVKQQRTLARCETLCEGYKLSCSPSEYYDKTVDRCEPCRSVCLNPRDGEECKTHCPNWVDATLAQPNSTHRNISAMPAIGKNLRDNDGGHRYSTTVFVLVGVLLVCIALLVVFRKPVIIKMQQLTIWRTCNKRSLQEEDAGDSNLSLPLNTPGRGPVCAPTDEQDGVMV